MATNDFTGVILAGGASRRMGVDKASLTVGECTMLEQMRRKLTSVGAMKIVVLGRPDEADGIADLFPGSGPATAIAHYLERQDQGSRHLFVPVDMPAITVPLLRSLATQQRWSYFEEHYFPFLGIADSIDIKPTERLQDLLMIKVAQQIKLPNSARHAFTNLNSPADFTKFVETQAACVRQRSSIDV
jgi:molybdopterin-guanine dinucleotide biosynthesis protein A